MFFFRLNRISELGFTSLVKREVMKTTVLVTLAEQTVPHTLMMVSYLKLLGNETVTYTTESVDANFCASEKPIYITSVYQLQTCFIACTLKQANLDIAVNTICRLIVVCIIHECSKVRVLDATRYPRVFQVPRAHCTVLRQLLSAGQGALSSLEVELSYRVYKWQTLTIILYSVYGFKVESAVRKSFDLKSLK